MRDHFDPRSDAADGVPSPPPMPASPPSNATGPWSGEDRRDYTDSHHAPPPPPAHMVTGPLPVCDYTEDGEAPCEEPATQKRWSSVAVVAAAGLGALVGGVFVAAAALWLLSGLPGIGTPQTAQKAASTASVRITPSAEDGPRHRGCSEGPALGGQRLHPAGGNRPVHRAAVHARCGQRQRGHHPARRLHSHEQPRHRGRLSAHGDRTATRTRSLASWGPIR